MTIRTFLVGTTISIGASWAILALIITSLDPSQASSLAFTLFFLVMFLAAASTAALLGYGVRRFLLSSQHPAHSVRPSLRQGIWLALLLDILLFLQLLHLLRWWIAFIIVLLFLSLEVLFLNYDRNSRANIGAQNPSAS